MKNERMKNEKRKMKKGGRILFSLLTFLFSLVLLFSCVDSLSAPPRTADAVPDGFGRVALSLTGTAAAVTDTAPARTAFPQKVFVYVYDFFKDGVSVGDKTPDGNGHFQLEVGVEWSVVVTAYLAADLANPYATGESEVFRVAVDETKTTTVPVELVEVEGNDVLTGTGSFKYAVTMPDRASADVLILEGMTVGELAKPADIDLLQRPTIDITEMSITKTYSEEDISLPAGFYLLVVKVSMDGKEAGFVELVHVYNGLPTVFDRTFEAEAFAIVPVINLNDPRFTPNGNETPADIIANIQAAIEAAVNANGIMTVRVIGTRSDWNSTLTLDIPAGKTVEWEGTINGATTGANNPLISINGPGTLNVTGDAMISNAGNGWAIYNDAGGTVSITGGTVSNTGSGVAIYNNGGGTITVSGGRVRTTGTGSRGITNNGSGIVNISGGTVEGTGTDNIAIYNNSAGTVNVSGGTITSAINDSTNATITNYCEGGAVFGTINITGGNVYNTATAGDDRKVIQNSARGIVKVTGGRVILSEPHGAIELAINGGGTVEVNTETAEVSPWKLSYGISLSRTDTYTFAGATEGYGTQPALIVTIANSGNQPTGTLSVVLGGADAGSFTVSQPSPSSMPNVTGASPAFNVRPNNGLAVKTHTATVTVKSDDANVADRSFTVSFAVSARVLTGISITTMPAKTGYTQGETLNLSGLTVTANYNNGSTAQVSSGWTSNPVNGAALNTMGTSWVTISYGGYSAAFAITVGAPAWSGTKGLKYRLWNGEVYVEDKGSWSGVGALVIPAVYNAANAYDNTPAWNGRPVKGIRNRAFFGGKVTSVTIPDSVTTIQGTAFYGCDGLTSITIPAGVTTIERGVFGYCRNFTSVTFVTASVSIGENAFPQGSDGDGGDNLKTRYKSGGAGTYTRARGGSVWTRVGD